MGSDEHDSSGWTRYTMHEKALSLGDDLVIETSSDGRVYKVNATSSQAASDIMLGWTRLDALDGVARDFYVRQLSDAKGSALVELMEPNAMAHYARVCGTELARAHPRSGDGITIAAYVGSSESFDKALATFAESYADQNDRDYEALKNAVDSGRLTAVTDV